MGKKNSERAEKIGALAQQYFDANAKKNEGAKEEKKARSTLEVELANEGEMFVHKLNNGTFLSIGFKDEQKEEIDPIKFMKEHPDLFWELVSVPKTAVIEKLGDKEAAKLVRVVNTHTFKLEKSRSDPRNDH